MAAWPRIPIDRYQVFKLPSPRGKLLFRPRWHSTSNAYTTPQRTLQYLDFGSADALNKSGDRVSNTTLLQGKPIAIKDNICTKDFPTTCASNILGDFKSPYNATVVELLQQAGAVIQGKTNMDEFGMGSHSTQSRFGAVRNYFKAEDSSAPLSAGGSSGGSAIAVQEGHAWAALGTDTGGSVRLPAAYTGVVGFKPSYGLLSRYGVVAYANSLDTVGILAQSLHSIRLVFGILNKHDPKDPTSLSQSTRSRVVQATSHRTLQASQVSGVKQDSRKPRYRIGVPQEYNIEELAAPVRNAWRSTLARLRSFGHSVHDISLPTTKQALSAYYVLAPAEACSNLAKYDGVRYGQRASAVDDETGYLFAKTRGEGFGKEVQRRILLGTYSLSAAAMNNYFNQAQKIRRLVQQDFDAVFALSNPMRSPSSSIKNDTNNVDIIVVPTAPTLPPRLSAIKDITPLDAYMNDIFTVPASLAGLPAVSVPVRSDQRVTSGPQLPVGCQVIGQFGDDSLVLDAAKEIREAINSDNS